MSASISILQPDKLIAPLEHPWLIELRAERAPHSPIVKFNRLPRHYSTPLESETHLIDSTVNFLRIWLQQMDWLLEEIHHDFHESRGEGWVDSTPS